MAGEKKITSYQDGVNLAREIAAKEQKALPEYQEQALGYRKHIGEVLGESVDSLESALQFMIDFSLCNDDRTVHDKRAKKMTWPKTYRTFFTTLGVNRKDSNGKRWPLKTVKSACDMIHGTTMKDFFAAEFNAGRYQANSHVLEFLKEVESCFIKNGYLPKPRKYAK